MNLTNMTVSLTRKEMVDAKNEIVLYDYEEAKRRALDNHILPAYNDGSRPKLYCPFKEQTLRCGKWIPDEEMCYRILELYFRTFPLRLKGQGTTSMANRKF